MAPWGFFCWIRLANRPPKNILAAEFMRLPKLLILLALVFSPMMRLQGHQVASVELEFLESETTWRLAGEMDIAYMLPETRNVPGGLPLSRAAVMKYPNQELARIRTETENTLRKLLRITFAENEVPWRVEFPDFDKEPLELPPEAGDIALLSVHLDIPPVASPGELKIHWAGEQETELIILVEEGDEPRILATLPGGSLTLLRNDATSAAVVVDRPIFWNWILSGFRHVIPLGLDHMLFILGFFLLVPKWKPLLGQSLLFTTAHSVTLALAVLGYVTVPSKFVEIMIAVSIAWIGIENLFTQKVGKRRLILVFCFGLLHGLGFASVLAGKLGDTPREELLKPLLGFNLGVELAQITVLCTAFLIFWPLKKWQKKAQIVGSVFVALAGLGWMVERIFS